MRKGLFGHRAAVNVVDFDEKHIVSASGDRTIKVWTATTCEFVRTLSGHRRGIGMLIYNMISVLTFKLFSLLAVQRKHCCVRLF